MKTKSILLSVLLLSSLVCSAQPAILLPTNGATLLQGTNLTIRWQSDRPDNGVAITFLRSDGLRQWVAFNIPNTGEFTWIGADGAYPGAGVLGISDGPDANNWTEIPVSFVTYPTPPRPAPVPVLVMAESSPSTALRNAPDQLLAVFRLNIANGQSLYALNFMSDPSPIPLGGTARLEAQAIRCFEIREVNGTFVSGSERWNIPGQGFVLPPEDQPVIARALVPTSSVTLNRPLVVRVYGTTPDASSYMTTLTDVTTIREDGNFFGIESPFLGAVSHVVSLSPTQATQSTYREREITADVKLAEITEQVGADGTTEYGLSIEMVSNLPPNFYVSFLIRDEDGNGVWYHAVPTEDQPVPSKSFTFSTGDRPSEKFHVFQLP